MTEARFARLIIAALRARLPKAVIFKHNDRMTAGVPDLSVTYCGRTTWLELKVVRSADTAATLGRKFNALQLATMYRLGTSARYLIVDEQQQMGVQTPGWIREALADNCRVFISYPWLDGLAVLESLVKGD